MSSTSGDRTHLREGGGDERNEDNQASAKDSGDKNHNEESLKKQPWFWPYTTRDEAERRLAGKPDGTFLIRECSVPGDFTLTVRNAGGSRCVRIYRHPKGYRLSAGEAEDTPFPSLPGLVEFYRHRSLSTFNRRLDVCLAHPLAKPSRAVSNQYGVFKELYDLSQDQLSSQTRLNVLQQQRSHLDQKFRVYELMFPALRVVQQMYYNSMQLQEEQTPKPPAPPGAQGEGAEPLEDAWDRDGREAEHFTMSTDAESEENEYRLSRDEEKSFTANTRLLLSRHSAMSDKLHTFKSNYDVISVKLQDLDSELQHVEYTLLDMKRRQEELISQMVVMGCRKEYLCCVLEARVSSREFDRSTWLRDCTRDGALALLEGLPHGAFLVRRKDQRHLPYVLSVVVSREAGPRVVQHCYIVRPHGRGYGFNAALAVFESIDQLVLRHRHVSLRHYFSQLDVALTFPVGCQELLHRSLSESEKDGLTVKEEGYANAAAIRDALEDSVYEPVDPPEGSKVSSEPQDPNNGKKHRLTGPSAENTRSSREVAGVESVKRNEYESVDSPRRYVVMSSKVAAVSAVDRERTYESVDEPVKSGGVSGPKVSPESVKVLKCKPSRAGAVSAAMKEHKYESVNEPRKTAGSSSSKGTPLKRKVRKSKPSKTATASAVVKEHKYEPVSEPSQGADCGGTRGSKLATTGLKYEVAGLPGAQAEAVEITDYYDITKHHTYETVSKKDSSEVAGFASSQDDGQHHDENVYEAVINPVRHTAV
ncbi:hypothetical protein ACOMHN_022932 [Nucella lapillus]